jgi:environmental stress-induced protein Ves
MSEGGAPPAARVIRAGHLNSMPWKNGGGATNEICVHPAGAGLDDFGWRVSIATVASNGPFSVFAGIDRTLAVLEGDGLRLVIGNAAPVELRCDTAPLSFAADTPTHARLIDSAVTDLNVMTRRGDWRHAVTRLSVDDPTRHTTRPGTHAVTVLWLCHRGLVTIEGLAGAVRLRPLDAWVVESPPAARWHVVPEGTAELVLVEIERLPAVGDSA